ncbi:MAG: hypothetical protein AAF847_02100, partial [Bacteroidota bacterium]
SIHKNPLDILVARSHELYIRFVRVLLKTSYTPKNKPVLLVLSVSPVYFLAKYSKVDTFLKFVESQTKNLSRRTFYLLGGEFEGEKHEKLMIFMLLSLKFP